MNSDEQQIEEYQAGKRIRSMQLPLETEQKCRMIGRTAGGSCLVMDNCIQKELKDKGNKHQEVNETMPYNKRDSIQPDRAKRAACL